MHTALAVIVVVGALAAFFAGLVWRLYRGDRESDAAANNGFRHPESDKNRPD